MTSGSLTVGELLRQWRRRRRLSQLDLASEAEISQRHLSFVESGRSAPSRDMVLRLAERLSIPLRERNVLLMVAGFAPVYGEHGLDDNRLSAARQAIELILNGHAPHPALAVDRHSTLFAANRAVDVFLAGVADTLLEPPVNVLRLSLHPDGLAPRIINFREWRAHVIARLAQQIDNSADAGLIGLLDELKSYPIPPNARPHRPSGRLAFGGIAIPMELASGHGNLSFISTTTVFGTALDITLSELTIESFFPADSSTADVMRRLAIEMEVA